MQEGELVHPAPLLVVGSALPEINGHAVNVVAIECRNHLFGQHEVETVCRDVESRSIGGIGRCASAR